MSINNNRMKWWEKYRTKIIARRNYLDKGDLRDLLRAALLRMLHAKVDALDIDKVLDTIIEVVGETCIGEQKIMEDVLRCIPGQIFEEDTDD